MWLFITISITTTSFIAYLTRNAATQNSNYEPIINNKSLVLWLNNTAQAVYCIVPLKGSEYHKTVGHITWYKATYYWITTAINGQWSYEKQSFTGHGNGSFFSGKQVSKQGTGCMCPPGKVTFLCVTSDIAGGLLAGCWLKCCWGGGTVIPVISISAW